MHKKIAEIIRVNQAGEYGAKYIYVGQLKALANSNSIKTIQQMYEQELEHLEYFDQQLIKQRIRPTFMSSVWKVGAYALGYLCGKLGEKAAMACTAAIEEVIEKHYQQQIDCLEYYEQEQELKNTIKKFQDDEIHHKVIGLENSSEEFHYQILKACIKVLTKFAIQISKKI